MRHESARACSRFGKVALATALLASILTIGGTAAKPTGTAEAAPLEIFLANQGIHGPITVIGDSVLLGSGLTTPTLASQLVDNGWGPVRFRAGEAYSTGIFPVISPLRVSNWITTWRAQGWDPENVVVNLGANDAGFCDGDKQCARNAILHLVDAIGPGHQIWWPQITRIFLHSNLQNAWNTALIEIAGERDNFHTWDWPTVMATEGYISTDGVHIDPAGYRRRSERMAVEITADLARASRTGTAAMLPKPSAAPGSYQPLPPERIIDTRTLASGRASAGNTLAVDFGSQLPPDAIAVAINVTAAVPAANGYLAAAPCGTAPAGSTVNFATGRSRGAMTIVPLGTNGDVCIYAHADTDIVVDLQGVFVGNDEAAGFSPLPEPQRLADTRNTGRSSVITVSTPPGADAVAVNLTATNASTPGHLRAYPCDGDLPEVSNVNFSKGEAIAGSAFVPTSDENQICVFSNVGVDVVVDLTGTFETGAGLAFVPAAPTRMLDTRSGIGGWSPIQGAGQAIDFLVAPPGASAVTGTLTMVRPLRRGYVTGYGCASLPTTSSLNAVPGTVLANSITTGISDSGRLCVYANQATQSLFDTTGWWVSR
jgi:lysophospholipase L1-like esterase